MKYDVDYFIAKFEAIPEPEIGTSQIDGCAFGQCRTYKNAGCDDGAETREGRSLESILKTIPNMTKTKHSPWGAYNSSPARINNGEVEQYQQPTPKQRILAALYDIKKLQSKDTEPTKPKEKIRYVSIPETITAQTKELILS